MNIHWDLVNTDIKPYFLRTNSINYEMICHLKPEGSVNVYRWK